MARNSSWHSECSYVILLHSFIDLQLLRLFGDLLLFQPFPLLLLDLFLAIPPRPLLFLCNFFLSFSLLCPRFDLVRNGNALTYSNTSLFANPSSLLLRADISCGHTPESISHVGSFNRKDPPGKLAARL